MKKENQPQEIELTEWIEDARNGDRQAFRAIYERFKDEAYRLCLSICRNTFEAEEALQENFIRMYRNMNKLKDKSSFRAWMYRILINTSRSIMRTHRNRWEEIDGSDGYLPEEDGEDNYRLILLNSALQKLSRGYRTVFVLHFFQELTHEEISLILNISPETSKSQFHRAKGKLKNILMEMGVEFGK